MKYVLLLCILPLINGIVVRDGKCPEVDVVTDIDHQKLSGIWYTVETHKNEYDGNLKCVEDKYNIATNGVGQVESEGIDIETNKKVKVSFGIRPKGDPKVGNYVGEFNENGEIKEVEAKILATDYDNYFVFWSCKEEGSKSYSVAWIEGRNRNLPETYRQKARDLLNKFNLGVDELIKIDQENCNN